MLDVKDIAIYGAGGFGKEVACLINRINEHESQWNLIGFFDDAKLKGYKVSHFGVVLGGINELNDWPTDLGSAIAIGDPKARLFVRQRIRSAHIKFPNLVHPSLQIADFKTFAIGEGNIIQGDCSVSCDIVIGDFNVLNGSVALGHDAKVGDFNVIMPDTRISGEVIIGDCNLIGVGSIILQQIVIGNNVTLGAGAVLLTKPKNGNTYIGNPARLFKYN